jgi:hypothetical protein
VFSKRFFVEEIVAGKEASCSRDKEQVWVRLTQGRCESRITIIITRSVSGTHLLCTICKEEINRGQISRVEETGCCRQRFRLRVRELEFWE